MELFKKLLPMALGLNLLLVLSEGVSAGTEKNPGFGTPTISVSEIPESGASPIS
jgi:hypothetical protein